MNEPDNAERIDAAFPQAAQPDVVLTADTAAATLPELLARLAQDGTPVIIAIDDEPRGALVSTADLADLRRFRRAERRRAALAELERLNAAVSASNEGFSDEEAEELGKRLGKEVNRAITERLRREANDRRRSA